MENKYKFGYEDSDKSISVEIYGLEFKINDLSEEDIKEIKELKDDIETIEKFLIKLLGENSIEKINEQRKKDGYAEMDFKVKTAVLSFVFETYCNELVTDIEGISKRINNSIDIARSNNRRYNKYRNNHRRY